MTRPKSLHHVRGFPHDLSERLIQCLRVKSRARRRDKDKTPKLHARDVGAPGIPPHMPQRRNLSMISLSDQMKEDSSIQQSSDQSQSLFYKKLPVELRLLICEMVLGGNTFILHLIPNKAPPTLISHTKNPHVGWGCLLRSECYFPGDSQSYWRAKNAFKMAYGTSLLLTCRKM